MKYIGIAAYSREPNSVMRRNADELINKLSRHREDIYILLGGYWGYMKYIADQALSKGIRVVFTLPSNPPIEPPNTENTVIIRSDLGFVSRSTLMVYSSDILVAMGGGIGSIIEVAMAYDAGKPVVIVRSGMDTDKIPTGFGEYIDSRRKARIYYVEDGVEAYNLVKDLLHL